MSPETNMVGKYLITAKIAEGGMGAIYKAKHPTLNRTVILKRLTLKKNAAITERFKREAELMMDFRNDNIVQVYDHFKEGNSYYIAMEYVDGVSLGDLIDKKRYIPNEIAVLIFREICKALKYAHDKTVIHRDIKPENVLISKEGEIKLTDFGIATSKDTEDDGLTSAGMTLGTPAYMSPEQISDTKAVDNRADIYSMGVVLYKMVTGKTPFPSNFTPDAIAQINRGEYTFPRKINPRVSPLLQKIIKKAMHHKVKKRYKDLQHIIDIFSKELKKKYKEQETINNTIKAYLLGKDVETIVKVKTSRTMGKTVKTAATAVSSNIFKIIITVIIVALVLAGCTFFAYYKGMHYEYLKANEYGALTVAVKIREKEKNPENNYVSAFLYESAGKGYKQVDNISFDFQAENENGSKFIILKSKKLYLKTSGYLLHVNYGNVNFQKDFYLSPRQVQKANKDMVDSEKIEFFYRTIPRLPLTVYYKVIDSSSKSDISNDIDFSIYVYKKWMSWKDFIKHKNYNDILVTGTTHRFLFKKDGYYSSFRKVYVEPDHPVLTMEVDLTPIPGELIVRSNYISPEVLLNNSPYYLSGGNYRKYIKIEPRKNEHRMLLSPGDYFLTVKKSGLTKTIKTSVETNKSARILINYNKTNNSLDLELQ
ncbi:MAG: serine/threonine protein kinase [Spirochaetes bacterium]|nr:serine/threonine protein kinase [Spirochaetota bacterium]